MAAVITKNRTKGAPRGGAPRRKTGDWIAIHNGRSNRSNRILVQRSNRDWPNLSDVGSAAHRRLRRR